MVVEDKMAINPLVQVELDTIFSSHERNKEQMLKDGYYYDNGQH